MSFDTSDGILKLFNYLQVSQSLSVFQPLQHYAVDSSIRGYPTLPWVVEVSSAVVDHTAKKEDFPVPQIPGF